MKKSLPVGPLLLVLSLVAVGAKGAERKLFPHVRHITDGAECKTCHPAATERENLKESLLPTTQTCTAECHEQADIEKRGWSKIPPRFTAFTNFSHKAHLAQGKTCQDCHDPAQPPMGPGAGPAMPNHGICFTCHDGVKQSNACRDCHQTFQESRLSGMERDPSRFKPMDHHPGFLHDHQFAVRLDGASCASCHPQADFCSSCHQGENVEQLVHGRNWLTTHGSAAQKGLTDCQSCHEVNTYCTECHQEQGIRPGNHTPISRWMQGSIHGPVARRDIEYCASCHDQEGYAFVCARCHTDDGIQGNQPEKNIHPPGFRDNVTHGPWHDDPGAACFACHTRPNPARAGVRFCGYCHGAKGNR